MFSSFANSIAASLPTIPNNFSLTSALSNVSAAVVDHVQTASSRFQSALQDEELKVNEWKKDHDRIAKYQAFPLNVWQLELSSVGAGGIAANEKPVTDMSSGSSGENGEKSVDTIEKELKEGIAAFALDKKTFLEDKEKLILNRNAHSEGESTNTKPEFNQPFESVSSSTSSSSALETNSFHFAFNWQLFEPIAMKVIEESKVLAQMRFLYVPKKVDEATFWYRYFYCVEKLRHEMKVISLYKLARLQWDRVVGKELDAEPKDQQPSVSAFFDTDGKLIQNPNAEGLNNTNTNSGNRVKQRRVILKKEVENHIDDSEWNEFISDDFVDTQAYKSQSQDPRSSDHPLKNSEYSAIASSPEHEATDEEIAELEDLLANVDVGEMNENELLELEESESLP